MPPPSTSALSQCCAFQVKALHTEGLKEAVKEFQELQAVVLDYLESPEGEESPAREWYMPESDYYYYNADKALWGKSEYPPALPF